MDGPSNRNVSTKLLCRHLLTLIVQCTRHPPIFFHPTNNKRRILRVEILGTVVSRERKPSFLKFLLDDGTGVIPCVIWLNQNSLHWKFARIQPSDLKLMAEMAMEDEETTVVGSVVRVRGQVCMYRDEIQIKVRDVMEERDPNAQTLHWVDCVRLAQT
ncbi:CST complex subunit STN1 [Zostera marina]|uniref:CST complex subunit STN1 n=1 Tax=Zostera marina TaxID=29655 RepID=A0A0K9PAB9_ZOSMR|nr:CST complex subunit STN1 [Zostera marina]